MSARMKSPEMYIPTFADVTAAHARIKPYIHRTPVLTSSYFDSLTEAELFFKCENFQKAGVFKARGATNAVFGLTDEQVEKGVATHSSGNHALSLSYAAGRRGPGGAGLRRRSLCPAPRPRPKKRLFVAMAARFSNVTPRPPRAKRC